MKLSVSILSFLALFACTNSTNTNVIKSSKDSSVNHLNTELSPKMDSTCFELKTNNVDKDVKLLRACQFVISDSFSRELDKELAYSSYGDFFKSHNYDKGPVKFFTLKNGVLEFELYLHVFRNAGFILKEITTKSDSLKIGLKYESDLLKTQNRGIRLRRLTFSLSVKNDSIVPVVTVE